ncbi:MAG: glycosyltransferase, partial [Bradymonadaceae bacterium]
DHRDLRGTQSAVNAVVFGLVDAITCNSRSTLESYFPWEDLLAGPRSRVVHNGVDIDWIDRSEGRGREIRERLGVEPETFLVGSVASLVEQKDFSTLVGAARYLPEDVQIVVVGGGPLEDELQQLRHTSGVEDQIEFLGPRQRSEVYQFLHALDAFVMPSVTDGFCVALVEAMAAGLPVVCSEIDTFREVAGDVACFASPG